MAASALADRDAWLRLANTPGIGAVTVERLLARFGHPQAIVDASDHALKEAGVSAPARAALAEADPAYLAAARDWLAADASHHFITRDEARFPAALADLDPVPPWLYGLGDLDLLDTPAIAIVGSRNPSHAGRAAAKEFGQALATAGFVVVSGLASGIDAAAHEGALAARGMTIAVTGTGLDRVYPAANRHLAREIAESGLLVSEFPLGTQPARANFPRRNRIIAGLSVATLVVEAARASGSLITARLASSAGREVFAMPGSIHNPLARGCHQLIRDGAKLVETTEHIIEEIAAVLPGYHREHVSSAQEDSDEANEGRDAAPTAADPLLEAVGFDPVRLDTLVARTGWRADEVSSRLLILELEGRIKTVAGGRYVRNS
ncbi:DNA-processing protein DprA [uncultured Salinisphaera sp.]|uniref:DNA-processing protein DprA n=1 Tax=uncultured Salinisphaera sp. TaxID=359372 RepID=UPI0032B22334|tara:strand:+ start:6908 stop:8041 length:1134 start_codon:yes stop_codon:yes gene_type:complete